MASLFNSVANIFRPVQQVTMAQQNADPTKVPASGASVPVKETAASNPMDEFLPLWQNDPKLVPYVDPTTAPLFNTDPVKIAQAAAKIDFLSQVPQEIMAKAMSGTDPAAFMQVLNSVAQRTLATSTQLNTATIEQATARNNARVEQVLPNRIKAIQLETMQSENPALQHPASQPILQLVRAQVQMKNPGMSAADINAQAERALMGFANQLVVAPAQEEATRAQQTAGTDWDAWAKT